MSAHRMRLPFSDLPQLHLETQGSVVDVVGLGPGEEPSVEVKGHPVNVDNVDGVVRLSAPWGMGDQRLVLHVPKNLRATIACDMGKLRVSQLAGCDLTLSCNAGSVDLRDARGRFSLKANAGEVRADNVGGTFELEASTGSVRMGIVALDAGTHRIRSTMGSVKVDLAPGIDVRIESKTTMGSTRTQYPSNPAAAAHLLLEAELGSVKVREGAAHDDERHGDWPDWRRWWATAASMFNSVMPPGPGFRGPYGFGPRGPEGQGPGVGPARPPETSPEILKVLAMVEQGVVTAEQADKLIRAIGEANGVLRPSAPTASASAPMAAAESDQSASAASSS